MPNPCALIARCVNPPPFAGVRNMEQHLDAPTPGNESRILYAVLLNANPPTRKAQGVPQMRIGSLWEVACLALLCALL